MLTAQLPTGATLEDLLNQLSFRNPELAPALRSALPIVAGAHATPGQQLAPGDEVALLAPVSGG
jgi:molybdopterin converting factor small subunit